MKRILHRLIPWMVRTLLGASFAAWPVSSVGQGAVVVFNNRVISSPCGPVIAPIYGPQEYCVGDRLNGNSTNNGGSVVYTGPLLAGTGFTAALYYGLDGTPLESFVLLGTTTFRTGAAAGFVNSVDLQLPTVPPNGSHRFQMRVWDNQGGTIVSWSQVLANSIVIHRVSDPFAADCANVPPGQNQSVYLTGLRSFNVPVLTGPPYVVRSVTTNVVVGPGATAILAADVIRCSPGYVASITQQWSHADAILPDATNSTLVLTNVQYADAGEYTFTIGSLFPGVRSFPMRLLVAPRLAGIRPAGTDSYALAYCSTRDSTVSVQFATMEGAGGWVTLGTATSATTDGVFSDAGATNGSRIYRLRLEP